jgi:hypothetical protein
MTKYATVSGFVGFGGDNVGLHAGDPWDDDHPFVKARPDLFTDTPPGGESPAPPPPPPAKPSSPRSQFKPGPVARG